MSYYHTIQHPGGAFWASTFMFQKQDGHQPNYIRLKPPTKFAQIVDLPVPQNTP